MKRKKDKGTSCVKIRHKEKKGGHQKGDVLKWKYFYNFLANEGDFFFFFSPLNKGRSCRLRMSHVQSLETSSATERALLHWSVYFCCQWAASNGRWTLPVAKCYFISFILSTWELHGLQLTEMSKNGKCTCNVKWTSFKLTCSLSKRVSNILLCSSLPSWWCSSYLFLHFMCFMIT